MPETQLNRIRTRGRTMPAFAVTPEGSSACIVVLHEVWGLTPHIKDVCKRLGKLGFTAVAPDLYWGYEGILTPDNIQRAMEGVWDLSLEERRDGQKVKEAIAKKKLGKTTLEAVSTLYDQRFRDQILTDSISCLEQAHSIYGNASILGFCLGGGLSLNVVARSSHARSAVAFYGEPPKRQDVASISSPMLVIYAAEDEIINARVPTFVEEAMNSRKDLTLKTYPGTRHGFFNDTKETLYKEGAAKGAWELTRWFLERTLQ